jgi:hypothetical protein
LIKTPIDQDFRDKFELDDLAFSIVARKHQPLNLLSIKPPSLTFKFGLHNALPVQPVTHEESTSTAQQVMELRARFGAITRWKSAISNEAILLADSIDRVLRDLEPQLARPSTTRPFGPYVRIKVGTSSDLDNELKFKLRREPNEFWKVDAAEIEAALSLAMSRIELSSQESERKADAAAALNPDHPDWIRATERSPTEKFHHVARFSSWSAREDVIWWTNDISTDGSFPPEVPTVGISGFEQAESSK